MFVTNFVVLCVVALSGMVAAKNNFLVLTYFKAGSNCTTGASGKTQEQFQMNICLDTMQQYVENTPGYVSKEVYGDYKCSSGAKTSVTYQLRSCERYDANNDVYPTAY